MNVVACIIVSDPAFPVAMPRPAITPSVILILFFVPFSFAIDIQNGVYRDIIIAISPNLREDSLENITLNLRRLFTKGSSLLCNATDGSAVFGEITIVVPSGWKVSNSLNLRKAEPKGKKIFNADIRVDDVSDFTVRRAGRCGQRGENIQVPASEILNPVKSTAKSLISAWSQFRYGVYPEYSPGNYYDRKLNQFLPNSCTNVPLNFTYENSICYNESSADCEINVNLAENYGISSSLLHRTDFANVKYFCDESTHNKLADTLQNRMCDRKSVKEIINQNEDFASGFRHLTCNISPVEISYVQHNCQRIFIGFALKEEHNFDEIVSSFQSSLLLTLLTTVLKGCTVTLLNDDIILFNETVGEDRSDLIKSISAKLGKNKLKPSSSIRNMLNIIKQEVNDSTRICDYFFLLFINAPKKSFWENAEDGKDSDDTSVEFIQDRKKGSASRASKRTRPTNKKVDYTLVNEFKELDIRVYGVLVGNSTDYNLDVLTSATGGETYVVVLDDGHISDFIVPMIALNDNERKKHSLMLQQHFGTDKTKYTLSYKSDKTDATLLIKHSNVNNLKSISVRNRETPTKIDCVAISLTNATSCNVYSASARSFYNGTIEEWTAETETEIPSPVSVTVVSRSKRQGAGLELSPSDNMTGSDIDFREKSLILYVCVAFRRAPVRNAEVELIISSGEATKFPIFDDGKVGDVKKGDGCYTGLWDRCVRPGRYNIHFDVTTTPESCALRKLANGQIICEPIVSGAQRETNPKSISVRACRKHLTGDFVKDLKVDFSEYGTSMATITWTNTWDTDTVANLTLRYLPYPTRSRNVTEWANSTLLLDVKIEPKDNKQKYPLDLAHLNEKYFTIALRAEDEAGKSEVSLPVNVSMPTWPSTTITESSMNSTTAVETTTNATAIGETTTTNATAIRETTTTVTISNVTPTVPNPQQEKNYVVIIVSVIVATVFAGMILLFVFRKWRMNRKNVAICESAENNFVL